MEPVGCRCGVSSLAGVPAAPATVKRGVGKIAAKLLKSLGKKVRRNLHPIMGFFAKLEPANETTPIKESLAGSQFCFWAPFGSNSGVARFAADQKSELFIAIAGLPEGQSRNGPTDERIH